MCERRRLLSLFVRRGAGLGPDRAGRCVRPRLPADRGSTGVRHPAAAEEDCPHEHDRQISAHGVGQRLSERTEALALKVDAQLAGSVRRRPGLAHERAYEADAGPLLAVCRTLRDAPDLSFEMLMDLAGVDYLDYG